MRHPLGPARRPCQAGGQLLDAVAPVAVPVDEGGQGYGQHGGADHSGDHGDREQDDDGEHADEQDASAQEPQAGNAGRLRFSPVPVGKGLFCCC